MAALENAVAPLDYWQVWKVLV